MAGLGRRATTDDEAVNSSERGSVTPSASVSGAAARDACKFRQLSAISGYLATFVTDDGGCPWMIKASPGQRINVIAYDFGWPPAADPEDSGRTAPGWPDLGATGPSCPVFVSLEERGTGKGGRAVRLCEVRHRRTVVYSSLGHELLIRLKSAELNATAARGQRLFLHYEGICHY